MIYYVAEYPETIIYSEKIIVRKNWFVQTYFVLVVFEFLINYPLGVKDKNQTQKPIQPLPIF